MLNIGSRRWWALGALAVALITFGLDMTILNVALPTVAGDLDATTSQLQWVVNAYTLVTAAVLLPAGLLGDRYGRKAFLLAGLTLFGVASVACAYAPSIHVLIAARAALGVGAAFMVPLSASMIMVMFSPAERSRAIGIWAAAMAVGVPIGPVLGGWLLEHFWWGSVFLINVPLIVVGVIALGWLLPSSPGLGDDRIDVFGVSVSSLGLVALTYGLVRAGDDGWASQGALAAVGVGIVLIGLFAWNLRRSAHPLVDPQLFSSAGFTWGSIVATIASFAMIGAIFVLPQYFSVVGGHDAMGAGLRLLPLLGGLLVGVKIADFIRPTMGAKLVVGPGFILLAGAAALGTTAETGQSMALLVSWTTLFGAGLGMTLPPAMDIALGALEPEKSGAGTAVTQSLRQVGGTFGVAVLGAVLNAGYRAHVDTGELPADLAHRVHDSPEAAILIADKTGAGGLLESAQASFVAGMDHLLWVCAAVAIGGAIVTWLFLPARPADVVRSQWERDHAFE